VFLNEIAYPRANFVANPAKDLHSLIVGTFRLCRVIDRPVLTKADAGEDRAAVPRPIANRDDVREMLAEKSDYIFGMLTRNINSDFGHGFHGQWVQNAWLQPGALRIESVASEVPQVSFGHLAAAGVAGAEKQDVTHGKGPQVGSRQARSTIWPVV
jgi:hypothetical protein